MRISIVIPVLNDVRVGRALDSILSQQHDHELEIVVVDAVSTDRTLDVIDEYRDDLAILVSEPDNGIFHGLNKAICLTSGTSNDVVHFLASDDQYSDPFVIRDVMDMFKEEIDVCYGDMVYVRDRKITRYWKAGRMRRWKRYYGWTPPHPATFLRRRVYEHYGLFDYRRYPISADYDFMLRVLFCPEVNVKYCNRVLAVMAPGGNSNSSLRTIIKANVEVARSCWNNRMYGCCLVPVLKPLRKVVQILTPPPPRHVGSWW